MARYPKGSKRSEPHAVVSAYLPTELDAVVSKYANSRGLSKSAALVELVRRGVTAVVAERDAEVLVELRRQRDTQGHLAAAAAPEEPGKSA